MEESDLELMRLHLQALEGLSGPQTLALEGELLAVSPDGEAVLVKLGDRVDYLELHGGIRRTLTHYRWQLQADFSSDGRHALLSSWQWCSLCSRDGMVEFYTVTDNDEGILCSAEFVGDSQVLLGAAEARVFAIESLQVPYRLPISQGRTAQEWGSLRQRVTVSPRGHLAASDGQVLRLWTQAGCALAPPLASVPGDFPSLAWSPDGAYLLAGEVESDCVLLIDTRSGDILWSRSGGSRLIACSPRARVALVLRGDQVLELLEADSGLYLQTVATGTIVGAGFLADGRVYHWTCEDSFSQLHLNDAPQAQGRWATVDPWLFPQPNKPQPADSRTFTPLADLDDGSDG